MDDGEVEATLRRSACHQGLRHRVEIDLRPLGQLDAVLGEGDASARLRDHHTGLAVGEVGAGRCQHENGSHNTWAVACDTCHTIQAGARHRSDTRPRACRP
eukprot:5879142-Prymnesium_polylepis.2